MQHTDTVSQADQGSADATLAPHLRRGLRVAGWAGVIGPVLFTGVFLTLERVRSPEFSPVELPVSALEAGPYGWVQQLSFVVFGLLTLVFAAGVHRGLRPSRRGAAGPALLAVSGLALLLAAAIPLEQDAAGEIYDPGGHAVAGTAFFATSAVGLVVLSRRIARDPAWSRLAGWTLAAGVTGLAAFLAMGILVRPDGAPLHDWLGLAQRAVLLVVLFPARIALSLRLLRLTATSAPPGRL